MGSCPDTDIDPIILCHLFHFSPPNISILQRFLLGDELHERLSLPPACTFVLPLPL